MKFALKLTLDGLLQFEMNTLLPFLMLCLLSRYLPLWLIFPLILEMQEKLKIHAFVLPNMLLKNYYEAYIRM